VNANAAVNRRWVSRARRQIAAGRFDEAIAALRRGLAAHPAEADALDALGTALGRSGRPDEAIAAYRAALAADPAFANAACNLGKMLVETGDVAEAMTWFDRAIALEPANGSFYLPLVTGGTLGIAPAHVAAMRALAGDVATLPLEQQIDLHFALGNLAEREARIDDAFAHVATANALKRTRVTYDETAALAFLDSTAHAFGNPIMHQLRGCGDASERPIFIVGMPRSGSTLVEQVLAAHPSVAAAGETGILGPIVREVWPTIAATSLGELRAQIRRCGELYRRAPAARAGGRARLTDKTLDNLQLAPLIHVTLPNARIIHVRRGALDTCWSCFTTSFVDDQVPFSYDLGELGRFYRASLAMMDRWRAFVAPDRLLEVDYENVVNDFESEARRIVAFCGLAWDPACLEFSTVRRPVRTASNLQVRQPLYDRSVGRAERFRAHLAPLSDALRESRRDPA
jgi:Tfp pilus assembly protein PilF